MAPQDGGTRGPVNCCADSVESWTSDAAGTSSKRLRLLQEQRTALNAHVAALRAALAAAGAAAPVGAAAAAGGGGRPTVGNSRGAQLAAAAHSWDAKPPLGSCEDLMAAASAATEGWQGEEEMDEEEEEEEEEEGWWLPSGTYTTTSICSNGRWASSAAPVQACSLPSPLAPPPPPPPQPGACGVPVPPGGSASEAAAAAAGSRLQWFEAIAAAAPSDAQIYELLRLRGALMLDLGHCLAERHALAEALAAGCCMPAALAIGDGAPRLGAAPMLSPHEAVARLQANVALADRLVVGFAADVAIVLSAEQTAAVMSRACCATDVVCVVDTLAELWRLLPTLGPISDRLPRSVATAAAAAAAAAALRASSEDQPAPMAVIPPPPQPEPLEKPPVSHTSSSSAGAGAGRRRGKKRRLEMRRC